MNHQFIQDALKTSPQTPGQLALALHTAGNVELVALLPENWSGAQEEVGEGYIISAGALTFTSLPARNQILAHDIFTQYFRTGTVEREQLFSIAHDLWSREIGHTDFASGRLLVEVSGSVDVLQLAAAHISAGANCFDVLHVIATMLVHARDLRIESLIDLARAQHDGTKHDFFSGRLYSAVDNWLTTRPEAARALYKHLAESADEVTASLLGTAIIGLSRSDPAEAVSLSIATSASEHKFFRRIGLWICGRVLQQGNISAKDRIELERHILAGFQDVDIEIRQEAVRAAADALHLSRAFDVALWELSQTEDQHALTAIKDSLFMKVDELKEQGRFFKWLPALVALAPNGARPMDGLDHVLSTVLQHDPTHRLEVIEFLTSWTLRHSGGTPIEKTFAHCFDQCMYKLADLPELFSSVITSWLIHEQRQLAGAAAGMLAELHIHNFHKPTLDSKALESMDSGELMFLAKRLLGFVHDPQQLLSLSLSMLTVEAVTLHRTVPLLRALVVDEIGYDYPGTTIKALTTVAAAEPRPDVKLALEGWRKSLESIQNELEQLPRLNELRPPSRLQRQLALARSRQMDHAQKEASKDSIMRQISTEIPLKAGRGWFNHMHGQYGEPSSLKSISYSVELPRREVLDPVGNAIRGFHLRTVKKSTE